MADLHRAAQQRYGARRRQFDARPTPELYAALLTEAREDAEAVRRAEEAWDTYVESPTAHEPGPRFLAACERLGVTP